MKEARDLFAKCCFTEDQLDALRQLYYKYFAPFMPTKYDGTATVALWYKGAEWIPTQKADVNHKNYGFVIEEAEHDPLWQHFKPLLPYMGRDAVITKMGPGETMHPHVDRSWRAQAIYFPIHGCTSECYSEYYDIPKGETINRQSQTDFPPPIYQYSIHDNAYLTNVHEWHGVRNTANCERVAFGWNFRPQDKKTYIECRDIMIKLGYIRE